MAYRMFESRNVRSFLSMHMSTLMRSSANICIWRMGRSPISNVI